MIGVDTNVLLRLFVADDPRQHKAAVSFFGERSETSPAFVGIVVLVEFIWSLGRTYGYPKDRIFALVAGFLASRDLLLEDKNIVAEALETVQSGKAGLADLLVALRNAQRDCSHTVTFDRRAAQDIPSMELLA